jgi:predicted RNA binding protein YcfA (HicA-like mRNA interferase family)
VPSLGPIKRDAFIRYLRSLGFDGPFSGTKHQFMKKGTLRLRIPNPHQHEIGRDLLLSILKEAEISRETWEKL